MGDHRVSLILKIEMHNKTLKRDFWVNWSDGFPQEIADLIEDFCRDAMFDWCAEQIKPRIVTEEEKSEIEELKRLRRKYPNEKL